MAAHLTLGGRNLTRANLDPANPVGAIFRTQYLGAAAVVVERSCAVAATAGIAVAGIAVGIELRSVAADAAGLTAAVGLVERPRAAAAAATGGVAAAGVVERLRSVSVNAVASVSCSGQIQQTHSRSASLSATASISTEGEAPVNLITWVRETLDRQRKRKRKELLAEVEALRRRKIAAALLVLTRGRVRLP